MIMGIGMALSEEALFDARSGRIMNASLSDYHVPVHLDVPEIDVIWTGIPDPRAPLGARGIGEIGITGVGRGDRQRRLQRYRQTRPRAAYHARQIAVTAACGNRHEPTGLSWSALRSRYNRLNHLIWRVAVAGLELRPASCTAMLSRRASSSDTRA